MSKVQQIDPPEWLKPQIYSSVEGSKPKKKHKRYTPRLMKPRLPTFQEQEELLDYVMEKGNNPQDQRANIESLFFDGDSAVVVFDNYRTYYGEYLGRLLVVIGDISPVYTANYIWVQGKIEEATHSTWKQIKKDLRQ